MTQGVMEYLDQQRTARSAGSDHLCQWAGKHSADPTPVTMLELARPCGHSADAGTLVPTCSRHLAIVESKWGIAGIATPCSVCGVESNLGVVARVPAR